jgi:hypothetical protein
MAKEINDQEFYETREEKKLRKFKSLRKPRLKYTDYSDATPYNKEKTEQHRKDECDINKIMQSNPQSLRRQGFKPLQDASEELAKLDRLDVPMTHEELYERKQQMEKQWYKLPLELRSEFGNDPYKFVDQLQDEQNNEKMYKLGVKQRPYIPQTQAEIDAEEEAYYKKIAEKVKKYQN